MLSPAVSDDCVLEGDQRRQSRFESREAGEVGLVGYQHETAATAFGGDRPAMHELVVVRRVGRHDAQDLRDIGRDKLLAVRVGAIAQRRARQEISDHALAVRRDVDLHPIAARNRARAAAQDAECGAPVVEGDGVVTAMRRDDEPRGRGHGASWSVFAAQMQSFSVTPPASCVDQSTTTLP